MLGAGASQGQAGRHRAYPAALGSLPAASRERRRGASCNCILLLLTDRRSLPRSCRTCSKQTESRAPPGLLRPTRGTHRTSSSCAGLPGNLPSVCATSAFPSYCHLQAAHCSGSPNKHMQAERQAIVAGAAAACSSSVPTMWQGDCLRAAGHTWPACCPGRSSRHGGHWDTCCATRELGLGHSRCVGV